MSRLGFQSIFVNGVCRVSFPCNLALRGRTWAQKLYEPYSPSARWVYRLWWRAPVRTRRLRLEYTEGPPRLKEFDWKGWIADVEKVLEVQHLKPIFYFPPQEDRCKTSVLLLDKDEHPVGFAKVALDAHSREALERETMALRYLPSLCIESFVYPSLIAQGCFKDNPYIIYAAIEQAKPGPRGWTTVYQKAWQEMRDKSQHRNLQLDRFLDDDGLSEHWREVIFHLKSRMPDKGFLCCCVHGDFAPWNALMMNGRLVLVDWEEFSTSAPYLTDVVYFFIGWLLLCEKRDVREAVKSILNWAGKDSVIDLLLALIYLARRKKLSEELAIMFVDQLMQQHHRWSTSK